MIGFNQAAQAARGGRIRRVREDSLGLFFLNLCHLDRILCHIEAKLFILYGRFNTLTHLSLLMMSMVLVSLMEIKCFWQGIAANKQQWCGFVAAASFGLIAACAFFVGKLVFWLPVAATLLLLVVATLQLIVAATLLLIVCGLFAALCVQRVCRPSCRLF